MAKRQRRGAAKLEVLESRLLLAFTTDLFTDINQFGLSANPDSLTELNSEVVFVADDGQTGSELWISSGSGIVQLADINPGSSGSVPSELTVLGTDLYFLASDDDDEIDLWKTDGTVAGTVQVFDADAAGVYEMGNLTASGTRLFFTAYEALSGYELWSTDSGGTTALVRDINPDQSIVEGPQELTDVNGTLFFTSYDNGYDNRELWQSNGSLLGTVLVSDIDNDNTVSSNPHNLTNVGGTLFFAAEDFVDDPGVAGVDVFGVELYTSTGVTGSTQQVADLNPGADSSYPDDITPFNGQAFFSANDGTTGRQLFSSNGSGITLVANTTASGVDSSSPTQLTDVNGTDLYFVSEGGTVPGVVAATGPNLTTDNSFRTPNSGHHAGIAVSKLSPNSGFIATATTSSVTYTSTTMGTTNDGAGWVSNGRPGDVGVGLESIEIGDLTIRDADVGDIAVHQWEWTIADPAGLTNIDFSGFLSSNEFDEAAEGFVFELFLNGSATRTDFFQLAGQQLDNWQISRTADNLAFNEAGGVGITSATVRMSLGVDGGAAVFLNGGDEQVVVGAQLTAIGGSSGTAGRELHKYDGSSTTLVKDIVPGGTSEPGDLTAVGSQLFFTANEPVLSGRELWVSDGSTGGTVLVEDIRPGFDSYGSPLSGEPAQLTEVDGTLFFSVADGTNDRELWSSGGTAATTDLFANVNTGSQGANIQQVVEVGSKIYFVADDGINGEAVWVADPVAGTAVIAADVTASSTDKISGLAKFGTGVIFHNDSLGIYTTDGVTTTPIASFLPIDFDGNGSLFQEVGSRAYFVHDGGSNGEELWYTTGGAPIEVDVLSGSVGSAPRSLVEFDNKIYFAGTLFVFGTNIRLVGSVDASNNVGNLTIGPDALTPEDLVVSGNLLYFTADGGFFAGEVGREVYSSNGGAPVLVGDVRTGTNVGSDATNLTAANGLLYFSANDGINGFEPYVTDGTSNSATLLSNINGGSANSDPSGFTEANGNVYFSAFESATGRELWVHDSAGTSLVSDLQPGGASSDPVPLGEIDANRLVLAATGEGSNDRELWALVPETSGPGTLTEIVDLNPGPFFGSDPSNLVQAGSKWLFVGDDGFAGQEFHKLDEVAPAVETQVIDDGSDQRSSIREFSLTFNSVVEITGDAFSFQNTTTSEAVVDVATVTEVNGKTVVNFLFVPGNSVNANGLLDNGDYELTVDSAAIKSFGTNLDGNGNGSPGGNYVFGANPLDEFYRKFGDENGNGLVDLLDFAAFRQAFGASPADANWNHAFDNEGDDIVGLLDFAAFRVNFGT